MSFEIYLQCFGETEKLGLPRDAIRALFPVDEAGSERDYWKLRYDSREGCDIGVNPLETMPPNYRAFMCIGRAGMSDFGTRSSLS